ncbi:glycosyl hydrolase [Phenylobacterium sp. LjRoot225]|uniref:M10 family metallopeptidase C-terminal domain-containing protein n=1 Tax=Phenylobacterium sp. LjRoot225 TaxID=3342285 RepID=UPI003ED10579
MAIHTGRANWTDYQTSIDYSLRLWANEGHDLTWTIPMFANGATLTAAATGAYDSYYVEAAKKLVAGLSGTDPIYIRTGEEFNGSWFPWAAKGNEAAFVSTFRHFVDAFRSVSDRFQFEWNVAVGDNGMDPTTAYPGDDYVDIIGMDFYYNSTWDGANPDPLAAFNNMVTRKWGLQWLEDFAAAHGKPTAYAEWGVVGDKMGAYIEKAAEWFNSHDPLYNNYWNSNASTKAMLSNEQYASTAVSYREAFAGYIPPGSLGDNNYVATSSSQIFPEIAAGGFDTVKSAVSYQIGDHIESLILTGPYSISGTGNADANTITGNDMPNKLLGMSGADTLIGGGGSDTLDGGNGNDRLVGGLGNDTYNYASGDTIVENAGEGYDTIISSFTVNTPVNIEVIRLSGSGYAAVVGNTGDNSIVGNYQPNGLYGGAGADTIDGGMGADTIDGGAGRDVLTGGTQNDLFIFTAPGDTASAAPDLIKDLATGDRIDVSRFDANTKVTGDQAFVKVAAFTGAPGQAMVAFDSGTGISTVSFDTNGDKVADSLFQITGDQRAFSGWIW